MSDPIKPATEPADDYQVADALEATNGLHDACITRVQAGGIRALVARIAADAARIRELEARQVPDGWQVVPKEPTEGMRQASGWITAHCVDDVWAEMLAAAPRP